MWIIESRRAMRAVVPAVTVSLLLGFGFWGCGAPKKPTATTGATDEVRDAAIKPAEPSAEQKLATAALDEIGAKIPSLRAAVGAKDKEKAASIARELMAAATDYSTATAQVALETSASADNVLLLGSSLPVTAARDPAIPVEDIRQNAFDLVDRLEEKDDWATAEENMGRILEASKKLETIREEAPKN